MNYPELDEIKTQILTLYCIKDDIMDGIVNMKTAKMWWYIHVNVTRVYRVESTWTWREIIVYESCLYRIGIVNFLSWAHIIIGVNKSKRSVLQVHFVWHWNGLDVMTHIKIYTGCIKKNNIHKLFFKYTISKLYK